tara:strand:+ start:97 stop:621 length:525 start_codon:yes stop_codon:yes gene_type:complete
MITKLKKDEALLKFEERKQKNIERIRTLPIETCPKEYCLKGDIPIIKNDKNEVLISFCAYCKEQLPGYDPWKSGVYIFPICEFCLVNASHIEGRNHNSENKKRRTKMSPSEVDVDWTYVNKIIDNKQAKLSLLASKYNLNSQDMRGLIIKHYGDSVVFRRGRAGGVLWNPKNKD